MNKKEKQDSIETTEILSAYEVGMRLFEKTAYREIVVRLFGDAKMSLDEWKKKLKEQKII